VTSIDSENGSIAKLRASGLSPSCHLPERSANTGTERDAEKCRLCGTCANACPFQAIRIEANERVYDESACMGCELCVERCPEGALALRRSPGRPLPLDLDLVRSRARTGTSVQG